MLKDSGMVVVEPLLVTDLFQRGPRHIWHDVSGSINPSNIRRLHERIHAHDFKNALMLTARDMVTVFGCNRCRLCRHSYLRFPRSLPGGKPSHWLDTTTVAANVRLAGQLFVRS